MAALWSVVQVFKRKNADRRTLFLSQRCSCRDGHGKESRWKGTWPEPWHWKEKDKRSGEDEESPQRISFKEKNCERRNGRSEVFQGPSWLAGFFHRRSEDTRSECEQLGCQTGMTARVGSRLYPRYQQMKDIRLFEGIIGEQASDT